jgi:hypothetical protein
MSATVIPFPQRHTAPTLLERLQHCNAQWDAAAPTPALLTDVTTHCCRLADEIVALAVLLPDRWVEEVGLVVGAVIAEQKAIMEGGDA